MITDPSIRFHHLEHASPLPVLLKKIFRRARMWVPLFLKRRRFEKNYATTNRALAVLCAGLAAAALLLSLRWPVLLGAGCLFTGAFFLLDLGFYRFLFKEGSFAFGLFASCVHMLISLVLFAGAVTGGLEVFWKTVLFNKKAKTNTEG